MLPNAGIIDRTEGRNQLWDDICFTMQGNKDCVAREIGLAIELNMLVLLAHMVRANPEQPSPENGIGEITRRNYAHYEQFADAGSQVNADDNVQRESDEHVLLRFGEDWPR